MIYSHCDLGSILSFRIAAPVRWSILWSIKFGWWSLSSLKSRSAVKEESPLVSAIFSTYADEKSFRSLSSGHLLPNFVNTEKNCRISHALWDGFKVPVKRLRCKKWDYSKDDEKFKNPFLNPQSLLSKSTNFSDCGTKLEFRFFIRKLRWWRSLWLELY